MDYLQEAVISSPSPLQSDLGRCVHAHSDSFIVHILGFLLPAAIFSSYQGIIIIQLW